MSMRLGSLTIKKEVESDVEALSSGDDSVDGATGALPASVLTTNYHDTQLPMLEDFQGPYNFTFKLPRDGSSAIKPTWEYSDVLREVFIKVDRVLIVQFSFDASRLNLNDIYIRAVLVYASADHVYTPVNRCAVHAIEDDPMNRSHADRGTCLCPMNQYAGHVVRCKSGGAIYCYDPKSERHSVLCPVKNTSDLLYSFRCKNSCPGGMSRRRTKLVFTLENSSGKMLGRASLDVKVCSCPRRDKDKMERVYKESQQLTNSNGANAVQWPPGGNTASESPPVMIRPSAVQVQLREGPFHQLPHEEEEREMEIDKTSLPGEVIMKIRSELRNIRQVLNVSERRFTRIQDLLNEQNES